MVDTDDVLDPRQDLELVLCGSCFAIGYLSYVEEEATLAIGLRIENQKLRDENHTLRTQNQSLRISSAAESSELLNTKAELARVKEVSTNSIRSLQKRCDNLTKSLDEAKKEVARLQIFDPALPLITADDDGLQTTNALIAQMATLQSKLATHLKHQEEYIQKKLINLQEFQSSVQSQSEGLDVREKAFFSKVQAYRIKTSLLSKKRKIKIFKHKSSASSRTGKKQVEKKQVEKKQAKKKQAKNNHNFRVGRSKVFKDNKTGLWHVWDGSSLCLFTEEQFDEQFVGPLDVDPLDE